VIPPATTLSGQVASLHVHPDEPGAPLLTVPSLELIAAKGIKEDRRYFGRVNSAGRPSRRQVTLIEREQIAEHATALGLESIAPGDVRSNIETTGIELQALMGHEVQVGAARLRFYEPRESWAKMDAICQGLRQRMGGHRQGVLAEVVQSGTVRVGDEIRPL
jgi:MOSC domain-containing protein YiiM